VKLDAALLNAVRDRLWEETETNFFSMLEATARHSTDDPNTDRAEWLKHLRRIALSLFDEAVPLSADSGGSAAPRIAKARRLLGVALAGYGPPGAALFIALGLPAVLAAGYAPAIGFLHTGKPQSFVYDIADILKFETVVPEAFRVAAAPPPPAGRTASGGVGR
jgi:hypothetical protein